MNGPAGRTIKPGKIEKIGVRFSSKRYKNRGFNKTLRVTSNDPEAAKLTLVCKGELRDSIRAKPSSVSLGTLGPKSEMQTRTILLEAGDAGPIYPSIANVTGGQVDTSIRELSAGQKYALDVTVHPPWDVGNINVAISVDPGNDSKHQRAISVRGSVIPRAMPVPRTLVISPELSKGPTGTTTLRWYHGQPAKILDATCTIPDATLAWEDVNAGQRISLTLAKGVGLMAGSHSITVKTDDEMAPTVEIPIQFKRKPDGSFTSIRPRDPKKQRATKRIIRRR